MAANAEAVRKGKSDEEASDIARSIGSIKANSFAQAAKQGNATQVTKNEFPPLLHQGTKSAARVVNRNKLSKTVPYSRGNAAVTDQSMVMQRPTFMKNKCLVIRGLRKDASRDQCIDYIRKTAGRKVDVLHIVPLSREYSPWLTIAVELNATDYEQLSNIHIWEKSIGIREFVGWRHWHGERPKRLAPHEIKNSVRMSWMQNGQATL